MKKIDSNEVINIFSDYFLENYTLNYQEKEIEFDISKFFRWSLEGGDYILSQPEDLENIFEIILKEKYNENECDLPYIKLINNPKTEDKKINRLRQKDFRKLITLKGVVISRTKVHPRINYSKYECPDCGNIINIKQIDEFVKEPNRCACGRKGMFKLIDNFFDDVLIIQIEELTESLKGSESPYNIYCIAKNKIVERDSRIYLGARVEVIGYLTEFFKIKNRCKLASCDFMFNIFTLTNLEETQLSDDVNEEEKELFKYISEHKNPARLISKWVYSDISGYSKVKELCVFQQFGGNKHLGRRDFIHILLYGDPGCGKSDIAFKTALLNPISKIATGTHTSGVGLTAAIDKDELTGKCTARGGLLARTNGGLAVIDELEKMSDNDKKSLHMPMESGFFTIEKAGITAKLLSNTSILGTANEKVSSNSAKVLDLPDAIIDRFDFLLHFKDKISNTSDEKIASLITNRATFEGDENTFGQNQDTFEALEHTYHISSIRKYIYICKKKKPKLSVRIQKTVHTWYSVVRETSTTIGWETKKPTPRCIESVLRLSRAIARSKLKDTVTIKELKIAIGYFDFMNKTDILKRPEVIDV